MKNVGMEIWDNTVKMSYYSCPMTDYNKYNPKVKKKLDAKIQDQINNSIVFQIHSKILHQLLLEYN